MKRFAIGLVGVIAGLLVIAAPVAHATILDLSSAALPIGGVNTDDDSGFINGAFFQWTNFDQNATGSGAIDSFVRMDDNGPPSQDFNGAGQEEGYNTDGRPVAFEENTSPVFTHSITLGSVPLITLSDGIAYREFLLDINQNGCPSNGNPNQPPCTDNFLSLDEVQIYLNGSSGSLTTQTLSSLGTLVYDLDGLAESYVKLNADLNPGNGKGDMFLYVPDSLFVGAGTQFVYLYSRFGINFAVNDGFEEWAHRVIENPTCEQTRTCTPPPPVIPEPSSLWLLGIGFASLLGGRGSCRRRF